ncbi:uncharacterized protein LOC142326340 [Lycorma delicatula]|uniref:uncharacterized protein LOC142326340 n=1 Tax=Lycorma delicatula TaxID=130591 RepID=UPI003F50F1FF
MSQTGVLGWLQIDIKDPSLKTAVTTFGKNIFNITSNVTSTDNLYEPQPLILRPEPQDSYVSQTNNFVVSCSLLLVIILHGIFSHSKKAGVSGIFALACLTMTAILAPIVGTVLLLLACYRQCVITVLKATCKRGTFGGLMKGNDAFWALEEDSSLSVINILALADFSFIVEASNDGKEPLRTVQELINDRLLSQPSPFPKLKCYRKHAFGYFYWEHQSNINVDDHVRWMEIPDDSNGPIPERILKNYVSSMSNAPLPADHLSGWEILIGRFPVCTDNIDPLDMMENGGNISSNISRYPILFRVHHSLGDGVALVRLLLDALADPCSRTPSRTPTPSLECNIPPILINNSDEKFYKSTYLSIPSTLINNSTNDCNNEKFNVGTIRKSASYNFEDWKLYKNENINKPIVSSTSLGDCVRAACHKFINLIEETNRLNCLQYQTQSLQNINILINDRPSDEHTFNIVNDSKLTDIALKTDNVTSDYCIDENNRLHYVTRQDRKKFKELFTDENVDNFDKNCNYFINFVKDKVKLIKNIVYHLGILSMLPATVMNQIITRTYDVNALHGPKLSGHKVIGWYLENEDDEDQCLMAMIKRIRLRTDAHFSDVILTALSSSFENYFKRFKETPNEITVVIPARIGRPNRDYDYNAKVATANIKSKELNAKITKLYLDRNAKRNHSVLYESSKTDLDNKFSVALLTLPIACKSSKGKTEGLFTKLKRVQKYTDILRNSSDYLVNYWILNVIATFFPGPCLRQLVKSTQSSLVVSNMPGPQKLAKLAGHLLHNIVFWVPNRETTGLGVTILSYNGRLQIGVIADRALIPCTDDAQLIVNGTVDAIKKMAQMSTSTA